LLAITRTGELGCAEEVRQSKAELAESGECACPMKREPQM
jgi:hypothetical protein